MDSTHSSKIYGDLSCKAASPSMLAKMIKDSGITKHDFIFELTRHEMDLSQLSWMQLGIMTSYLPTRTVSRLFPNGVTISQIDLALQWMCSFRCLKIP